MDIKSQWLIGVATDASLSCKEKGMALEIAILGGESGSVEKFEKISKDGKESVRRTIKSLEDKGYIARKKIYNGGLIDHVDYELIHVDYELIFD